MKAVSDSGASPEKALPPAAGGPDEAARALQTAAPHLGKLIEEWVHLWNRAEARLKRTERIEVSLKIPGVNELRYAGFHVVQALVGTRQAPGRPALDFEDCPHCGRSGVPVDSAEQLQRAKKHCQRAIYDACEAEILFYLELVKEFEHDFRNVVIDVPNFDHAEVRKLARDARAALIFEAEGRKSRDEQHDIAQRHCDPLAEATNSLEDVRPEINKRIRARRRRTLAAVIGTAIALAAAAGTITTAFMNVRRENRELQTGATKPVPTPPASPPSSPPPR